MKTIFYLLITLFIIFSSCKKDNIEPTSPKKTDTTNNKTNWYDNYVDGGVIPNNTNVNPIVGTKWILTKVMINYSISYPNDTIEFVSSTQYKVNSGSVRTYSLYNITGSTNKCLTLNYFSSFGGSCYSLTVGCYFISDGFINNAEATDLYNSSIHIIAWFQKI